MAANTVGRVALMSIHPQYAASILDGSKRVEFRKRPIAADVTHVIVYATAPVSAVVGAFTVVDQHTLQPKKLWRRFKDVAGIGREDFLAYYSDRSWGTGITVGDVLLAEAPLGLQEQLGIARPPQSFQYVAADTAATFIRGLIRQEAIHELASATI